MSLSPLLLVVEQTLVQSFLDPPTLRPPAMQRSSVWLLALWAVVPSMANGSGDSGGGCGEGRLAMYRMTIRTLWSPGTFPKHYPEWGPPASWSKVIGE